ncbi:hypothetical protein OIU74_016227 [Salix koriyanagi]|uniref:RNA polymerase II subunit B1 CTD phosphatase RPAP2 homolog n=1 Tax=Salix koriyanagi TaxID=2511006 RepID=A0A9Q0PFW3_9ROSI|nr:hypothetical protein OIU74_016227 [Salix koriyanagi]
MAKDQSTVVKDTVYKLQLSLLEGIQNEDQLFAAGSIMSCSDYEDVVTERTIANLCGYPLCGNSLPSDRPQKGRYRISLKEHKVYDLHETYMYCSSSCVINSRTFAGSLQEERCLVLNPAKLNEVLMLFDNFSLDSEGSLGKNEELGFSNLKIEEKTEKVEGEVSFEQWIGPSNAIEGYVPQRDRNSKSLPLINYKEGLEANTTKQSSKEDFIIDDMDFTSFTQDEYNISKTPSGLTGTTTDKKNYKAKGSHKGSKDQSTFRGKDDSRSKAKGTNQSSKQESFINDMNFTSTIIITQDEYSISKCPSGLAGTTSNTKIQKLKEKVSQKNSENQSSATRKVDSSKTSRKAKADTSKGAIKDELSCQNLSSPSDSCQTSSITIIAEAKEKSISDKAAKPVESTLNPSLKTSGAKKLTRSVTWADEKVGSSGSGDLCEVRKMEDTREGPEIMGSIDKKDDGYVLKFKSAEACAKALSEAAEAVASGDADASNALSEAGLVILPKPHDLDQGDPMEDVDVLDEESSTLKWPGKPGIPQSEYFDPENSWYETPPEGFSLELSPFATIWMALFAWVTSSSLAYVYGKDESSHEEYLMVNGREYPRKIVSGDGRSSEIQQTIEGCLSRSFPVVVADLRLPIPISTLEQGAANLLGTMSFVDAVPGFRMKQWQVIALLFIEALSVCRIPALISYMDNRRMVIQKVVDGARMSAEEYEVMKDLMIPLGRAPQFSPQSGA